MRKQTLPLGVIYCKLTRLQDVSLKCGLKQQIHIRVCSGPLYWTRAMSRLYTKFETKPCII